MLLLAVNHAALLWPSCRQCPVMEPELLLRTAEKHAIDNLAICLSKKNLDDCASEPFNDVHVMSFEPGLQVIKHRHAVHMAGLEVLRQVIIASC
jgi:hypothetical protein